MFGLLGPNKAILSIRLATKKFFRFERNLTCRWTLTIAYDSMTQSKVKVTEV